MPDDRDESYRCNKNCFFIFLAALLMLASFVLGVYSESQMGSNHLELFVAGSFMCFLFSIYILIKVYGK